MKSSKEKTIAFKRRLYRFVLQLIKFIERLPKNRVTKIVGDQLLRSGTSILANYVEAQSSSSRRDYTNFLNHSLKSANESKVWVALLKDTKNADNQGSLFLLSELDQFAKIFASSILTIKGKRNI